MEIEHIFILTLPHRKDRLDNLTKQLDSFGLEYEVFYGIDGKKIIGNYECDNLNNACTFGHGQILQRAEMYGFDNCLVLEDDCELSHDFLDRITKLELPQDWNVCYLSGTHREPPIRIDDNISKCVRTLTTHAYLFNSSKDELFYMVNDLISDFRQPVDCYFVDEQSEFNFYVVNKPLAWQSGGFSDVNQREMYYEHLKEEI